MKWTITYSARSHLGLCRGNNEDNLFVNGVILPSNLGNRSFSLDGVANDPAVFAVCNGRGGEEAGETASLLAVETLRGQRGGVAPRQLEEAVRQCADSRTKLSS